MALIKAFFFDLDGTLVDTHGANLHAYTAAIKTVVKSSPSDDLISYVKKGVNSKEFLPKVVPGISEADMYAVIEEKKRVYPEHLHHSQLNEFLKNFLTQMSVHHKAVLVTTAKKDNALAVLRYHGIESMFSYMVFGDDVENMKPHPDAYLKAMEIVGLNTDEILAFEDSENGMQAAMAAGLNFVHIKDFE